MSSHPLQIAVASGKGGTGKTTIATSLARVLADDAVGYRPDALGRTAPVAYLDCDVEEPNGHLFLRPTLTEQHEASVPVPEVDLERCTRCGACGRACRSSAIVCLPQRVLTYPQLCHGCGGCTLACPVGAIREVPRRIGVVEAGDADGVRFVHGRLDVGEAMAPPLIRAVHAAAPQQHTLIIDAPPGASCPVVETVRAADVVALVAEPTPFGVHDLDLAVQLLRRLDRPFGVVINRYRDVGDLAPDLVSAYCAEQQILVLAKIPDDRRIAQAYSRGELMVRARPELAITFGALYRALQDLAARGVDSPPPALEADERRPIPEFTRAPPSASLLGPPPVVDDLVVISGKGGTGKTSILAALADLADRPTLADCDVDAADLHLLLEPRVEGRWPFFGGELAQVDEARCDGCGRCEQLCRFDAIAAPEPGVAHRVDPIACEGCGVCVDACPRRAISLEPSRDGEWMLSQTRRGPLVHATLGVAAENSGKLVSRVRREATVVAAQRERTPLLCDGSPGIGCPVIASLVGSRRVLLVTEPTCSGLHDLARVAQLCRQLELSAAICINKVDLNPEVAAQIEDFAVEQGLPVVGRVRYDEAFTAAQLAGVSVVEHHDGPAAADLRALWARLCALDPETTAPTSEEVLCDA